MTWSRTFVALALFVGIWLVYRPAVVSQGYNWSDPLLLVPTSRSILYDHDLELSEFIADVDPDFHGLLFIDGRPYNRYPIGASLLVLPLVWLEGPPAPAVVPMDHALFIAGSVAKKLAALSVALLFLLLVTITDRVGLALALALLFAFGTPHYPIHAGGFWTHNAVLPLVLVALLLLLAVRDGRYAWSAAIPLGFRVRHPADDGAAHRDPERLRPGPAPEAGARLCARGLAMAGIFCAWSQYMYGSLLPPYYRGLHSPRMAVGGSAGTRRTHSPAIW